MRNILTLGLLILSFSASANIFTVIKSKGETSFAFQNIKILERIDRGELSFEEFKNQVVKEIIFEAENITGCSFEEGQVCPSEVSSKLLQLTYHLPNFVCLEDCDKGISQLQNFPSMIQRILYEKSETFNFIKLKSHNIGDFTLSNPDNLRNVENILSTFTKHEVENTSYPYCDLKYLGGDKFDLSSYDQADFNQSLCLGSNMTKTITVMLGLLNNDDSDALLSSKIHKYEYSSNFPIQRVHQDYKDLINKIINDKLGEMILLKSLQQYYIFKINNYFDPRKNVLRSYISKLIYTYHYTPLDIKEAISIAQSVGNSVSYDGVQGVHIYHDHTTLKAVFDLAMLVAKKPDVFVNYIIRNNLLDIFQDTNTSEESSRLEIIDLISNMLYRLKKAEINNERKVSASFKDYMKSHILSLLGLSAESDLYIFPRNAADPYPVFECSNAQLKEEGDNSFNTINLNSSSIYYISDISFDNLGSDDNLNLSLTCGKIPFTISMVKNQKGSVLKPKKFEIKDGYVDIVLPFSLVGEINENFKKMARTYYTMLGFDIEVSKIENTKVSILDKVASADVFIPVGHALVSRELRLGTKVSELWTMTREPVGSNKLGIRFYIYLPTSANLRQENLTLKELAQMYRQRIISKRDPLFVFIQTCHGEENLPIWSLIYRNALRNGLSDNGSLPYVIASKRGFPTSSNVEIAGNVLYPTDLADILSEGKHPKDVYEFLKNRNYGMFSDELINIFSKRGIPEIVARTGVNSFVGNNDVEVSNFDPVYNLSEDNLEMTTKSAGTQYKVIRGESDVIFDETY